MYVIHDTYTYSHTTRTVKKERKKERRMTRSKAKGDDNRSRHLLLFWSCVVVLINDASPSGLWSTFD